MSEQRWILDRLPMGVWVARAPDGVVVEANAGFEVILGMPPVSSSRIDDAPVTYAIFDRKGAPYPVERLPFSRALALREAVVVDDIVIHRGDGKRANVRAYGTPVFGRDGEITHVVVAFLDITKEVEAELARDTLGARLSLAVNHAPIIIWTADERGVVTFSDGAGLRALSLGSDDMVGQNLFEVYGAHATIPEYLNRCLAGESFWCTIELDEVVYDSYLTPLRDAGGRITGMAGLSNEVTELRKLQRAAVQNDRVMALGTLAASVAHEINNPLTYLLVHLGLWERDWMALENALRDLPGSTGDEVRERARSLRGHFEPIHGAAQRIARVTRQLGGFSRAHGERLQAVEPNSVIRIVLDLIGKEAEARTQLRLELGQTPSVRADEASLVQVVLNLVINAMQALHDRARHRAELVIRTCDAGGHVVLEVEDNGPGVPLGERERVFEPFFTTKPVGEGTGLGLFVSRSIVRALGGDIIVSHAAIGGARFSVTLPVPASPAPTEPSGVTDEPRDITGHILVVDDDPMVAHSLVRALRGAGHRVASALDATSALEMLQNDPYDLIFCDLMMPDVTGVELAEILRARGSRSTERMVFMTGGAFTPKAREFAEANRARTVEKPFDVLREAAERLRALGAAKPR